MGRGKGRERGCGRSCGPILGALGLGAMNIWPGEERGVGQGGWTRRSDLNIVSNSK